MRNSIGTYLSVGLAAIVLLAPIQSALAQEGPASTSTDAQATSQKDSGLESCFDYYRFGSVPVVLSSDTVSIAQGGQLHLIGTVTNENKYPVDDVSVYAKAFYKKDFEKNSFGPDVVDSFVIADRLNLKAGESRHIDYTWAVPANLQPGNYQIASYVASHDRFNLAGLTFTNDITGGLFNFNVVGEDQGAVRFDNTQITVGIYSYHAAIFPPRIAVDTKQGTPVKATISNTSSASFSGTVHWKLYSWDGTDADNLITESSDSVSIDPHASTTVSYTLKDSSKTVYYLIGELDSKQSGMQKSYITVRFVDPKGDGSDTSRIAFVAADGYPGTKDGTKAFACFHSEGKKPANDVRMELTATPLDPLSWLLHLGSLGSKTFTGSVPGQLSAISVPLSAASNNYSVTATLYQGGHEVDSVTSTYSCKTYGSCSFMEKWGIWIALLAAILVIILIVLSLLSLLSSRRKQPVAESPYSRNTV